MEDAENKVKLAKDFCKEVHQGQVDKAGEPYYKHPFAVAEYFEGNDPLCVICALLHDTLEDCEKNGLSREYVAKYIKENFGESVLSIVEKLTKKRWQFYCRYLDSFEKGSIAYRVKVADVEHNFSRLDKLGVKGKKLLKKYNKARKILGVTSSFDLK